MSHTAADTTADTTATVTIPARAVRPLKIIGGIAVVVGVLGVVDTGFAMHAEHTLAQQVKAEAQLENTPQVYVGGMPYLGAAIMPDHEIPLMEVNALDIEVPRLGLVNASTTLRDVQVTPDQLFSGNFTGASVSTWSRAISVDAVSLGRLMGINDLQIANPKNISPTSGTSAEADLVGTLPGDDESTTVEVTLRLIDEKFIMTPVNAENDRVAEAFSYSWIPATFHCLRRQPLFACRAVPSLLKPSTATPRWMFPSCPLSKSMAVMTAKAARTSQR